MADSRYSNTHRIMAKLGEMPYYLRDQDEAVVVENIFECLRDLRMIPLKRYFRVFTVTDYCIDIGCYYMIYSVSKINGQYYTEIPSGINLVNQVVFTEPEEIEKLDDPEVTYIEKIQKVIPHIIGPYIDYSIDGESLAFRETDIEVGVEFSAIAVDEKGYPVIPEQAEDACVAYFAYKHWQGEYMAGRMDGQRFSVAQKMYMDAKRKAISDHRLSKNQLDKILNHAASFDRKSFGWAS